ncbi:NUDIX hydrolase [Rhodococcus rhodnii]|uniref:NUDIX hydrolase n=1 Tax=Rhodococcus rhodnii TaxID=38312 RepID=UPI001EE6B1E6|nr:NUDIX hydrolase [Rhodococcus rhodnii]
MKQVKANIFAAGCVVWRHSTQREREFEIAIIHRPKYDDWSFPKGKLDPGETAISAAVREVREVREETGFDVRLGRYLRAETYPVPGHRKLKRVLYWTAEAVSGSFVPNDEVDELRWLPAAEAEDHLSYPMDRKVLREFLDLPPDTSTLLLVRHAKAGSRKKYRGDDRLRPLESKGRRQADALVPVLEAFGAEYLHSADRTRCVQTLEPLSIVLGTPIESEPTLSEEAYVADPRAAHDRLQEIASLGEGRVVCSQGGVIPDVMAWWAERDGVRLPPARGLKASTWVLSLLDGKLVAADHIDSPLPKT